MPTPPDEKPGLSAPQAEAPAVSSLAEVSDRLHALGHPALTYEQAGVILPILERLYEAQSLLRESKVHLNPAGPLAARVASYFARIES